MKKTRRRKLTLRDRIALRELCNHRIRDLQRKIAQCAGDLYPRIMGNQIGEIEALFEKITGYPMSVDDPE